MTALTPKQEELCATSQWDFSDLRAVYINCTLKRSPDVSHTQGLADRSIAIMERNGVTVEQFRALSTSPLLTQPAEPPQIAILRTA